MRRGFIVSILAFGLAAPARAQTDPALARQRAKIDALDARVVALLNERARVVQEIGRIKQRAGLAVVDPKRAEEVLQRITSKNAGPLPNENLRRIYERIIVFRLSLFDDEALRHVWEDTTVVNPEWERPIYKEFFHAVRAVNACTSCNPTSRTGLSPAWQRCKEPRWVAMRLSRMAIGNGQASADRFKQQCAARVPR